MATATTLPNLAKLRLHEDPTLQASAPRINYLKFCYRAVCDAIACEVDVQYNEPDSVQLVAVSSDRPASDILALYDMGQIHFGEKDAQELQHKAEIVSPRCL